MVELFLKKYLGLGIIFCSFMIFCLHKVVYDQLYGLGLPDKIKHAQLYLNF